jgi:hypothetical protein
MQLHSHLSHSPYNQEDLKGGVEFVHAVASLVDTALCCRVHIWKTLVSGGTAARITDSE